MSSSEKAMKRKIIIDTDAGLDDAQAILMALSSPEVEVIAMVTVTGNAKAKQVTTNLFKLLRVADRMEIPIYQGCEAMLLGWEKPADYNYHGLDGFGDVHDPDPPSPHLVQPKHGVMALLDLTREHHGDISIVAIGPLTNLAMAIRLDPEFGQRLKECYIMGGNYRAEGNITPTSEFNFHCDPEAAHIVLHSLGCPISLVTWELSCHSALSWDTYSDLRKHQTKKCQFLKKIEKQTIDRCKKLGFPKYTYMLCDELAMACAIDNDVIAESSHLYASVELHGGITRGQVVVDWRNTLGKTENVRLVTAMNMEKYKALLHQAFE